MLCFYSSHDVPLGLSSNRTSLTDPYIYLHRFLLYLSGWGQCLQYLVHRIPVVLLEKIKDNCFPFKKIFYMSPVTVLLGNSNWPDFEPWNLFLSSSFSRFTRHWRNSLKSRRSLVSISLTMYFLLCEALCITTTQWVLLSIFTYFNELGLLKRAFFPL